MAAEIIDFPYGKDLVKEEDKVALVCPTCESPYWRVFEEHVMECASCGQPCYMTVDEEKPDSSWD